MNRIVKIALMVVAALAIAAGSFYGGMVFGENRAQAPFLAVREAEGFGARGQFRGLAGGPQGLDRGQTAGAEGGMLFGEIQAIGDGELTVTDPNGQELQVYVADTTLIQKQAEVTLADLQQGEMVIISGNRDDEGNITARSLQVSPGEGFFGRPLNTVPGGN